MFLGVASSSATTSGTTRISRRAGRPTASSGRRITPGPGRGSGIVKRGGHGRVLNVMGRVFMPTADDPFRVAREQIDMLRVRRVSSSTCTPRRRPRDGAGAVSGRKCRCLRFAHARQTADEQISRRHRLHYRCRHGRSVRRCHRHDGRRPQRFTQAYGERFSVQKTGPRQFCAAVATIEVASGRALDVKRINLRGLA